MNKDEQRQRQKGTKIQRLKDGKKERQKGRAAGQGGVEVGHHKF